MTWSSKLLRVLEAPWTSMELIEAGVRRCSSSCGWDAGQLLVVGVGRSRSEFTIWVGPWKAPGFAVLVLSAAVALSAACKRWEVSRVGAVQSFAEPGLAGVGRN
jgi:hypothetical protein